MKYPRHFLFGVFACFLCAAIGYAAEGDLVEIMIVRVGNEVKVFPDVPEIQSAYVKDGAVTFCHTSQLPGTDYVVGYTFGAQVIQRDTRLNRAGMNFFLQFNSFGGFFEFGDGQRSPKMVAASMSSYLAEDALNSGWRSFELLAPRDVQRLSEVEEKKPRKVAGVLFVRWSRPKVQE